MEQQGAEEDGFAATLVNDTEWAAMSAADFRSYQVLIIGDPTCGYTASEGTEAFESASTWEPVVMASGGNKVLIGTDPTFHNNGPSGTQRGDLLEANGIGYAGAVAGATGLYLDLSCSYDSVPSGTPAPILDGLSGLGAGQFTVTGEGSIGACATAVNIVASTGPTAGLTDENLSDWNCSVHEAFDNFPSDYTPLALAPSGSGFPIDFCATDIDSAVLACGSPYILVSGTGVSSAGPSISEQGGAHSRSEHSTTCSNADPVNCATGSLTEQFTDIKVPGKGASPGLTRTYSSLNAETTGPFGYGWTNSYGMSLSVNGGEVVVHEEDGSTVTFFSNGTGGYVAPARVLASLVQNSDGTFTFARYADRIQHVFSESGRLIEEIDPNGYATRLAYSGGQLQSVTDSSGRQITFAYAGAHIVEATDPLGRSTVYEYDGAGDLTSVTDPMGRTRTFGYDGEHKLLTITDPRGGSTANTYDSSGRVTAQVDPAGRESTWSYVGDPASTEGATTTLVNARGDTTIEKYQHMELMNITRGVGTPAEATTSYEYDPKTLGVTKATDPDGHVTRSTYDDHGNLLTSTDPLGRVTTYTYNSLDEVVSETNPRGTTTSYSYDSPGNLLEKDTPLTETGETARTTYSYEAAPGEITAVTDPDGHITRFGYDSAGDRTSVTDADGNKTTYAYNADGELTSTVASAGNEAGGNPASHTTSYVYDAGGELTSETDPLGHTVEYSYDPDGNRTSVTDANGHTTHQIYDADNELIEVIRADGSTVKTHWDAASNMIAQVDAAGHTTSYAYDPLNRLTSTTDPNGHTASYAYDPAGNKTESINAEGRVTEYGYDSASELVSINYSDGSTPSVYQEYDADGNRTHLYDGTGTSTFTYDSLNRMTSTTDGSGATVGYEYDLAGNLTKLTYPNGQSVSRSYDSAGNLTSVADWLGHTTHFSYDADSNLKQELYPNSVTAQFGYDNADRLLSMADANGGSQLASFNYTRDAAGQVTNEVVENGESATTSYSRNSLDQLTAANAAPYGYDAADNPTTFGAEATQHFDASNELTSATGSGEVSEGPGLEPERPVETPKGDAPSPSPSPSPSPGTGGGPTGKHEQPGVRRSASSPRVDATITARVTQPGTLVSRPVHTSHSHDLMLVFVSAVGSGQRVSRVSGGGLHWKPVARQDGDGGAAEIWQAAASGRFAGRVTIHLRQRTSLATATVAAFGDAAHIADHKASDGKGSSPAIRLPLTAGSVLWGVGHSIEQSHSASSGAGQRIVSQFFSKRARTAGWVQRATGSAISSKLSDTTSAGHWALLGVAIASGSAQAATTSSASSSHLPPSSQPIESATGAVMGRSESSGRTAVVGSAATSAGPVTRQFSYNASGDRTAEEIVGGPTRSLTYDQADRLTGVGANIAYSYNGDGLRTSKTVSGVTTQFAWNQAEALPELLQASSIDYIYGPEGRPIEQIEGSTVTYLHEDQQGSVRLLTNAAGAVVGRYNYGPWGNVSSRSGSATSNLQYDGQYTDAETGYQYLRARYYDPATGQFLTPDPALPFTRSRYGFTANDPLDYIDSSGLHLGDPFGFVKTGWDTVNAAGSSLAVPLVCAFGGHCSAAAKEAGKNLKQAGTDYLEGLFEVPTIFLPKSNLPGFPGSTSGSLAAAYLPYNMYAPASYISLNCQLQPLNYLPTL